VRIRRGAAAVIGEDFGSNATANRREGDPEAALSREPEDLPVEFCSMLRPRASGRADRRLSADAPWTGGGRSKTPNARPGGKAGRRCTPAPIPAATARSR
jgi:hypothetical protein